MKVAFVTNYEKTIYFHGIATRLVAAGHEVSWISPSNLWARWLADHGVSNDAILDISRAGPEWQTPVTETDRAELAALETASGLRVTNVILMDRILRDRPATYVMRYFAVARRLLADFLAARDIAIVFAEQTFGIELVANMVCAQQNRVLLAPHVVRIPTGRMGFFRGHDQSTLVTRTPTSAQRAEAAAFLESYRRDRPRPDYFTKQDRPPAPSSRWPSKLVRHIRTSLSDPFDETHFSPSWLVRKRTTEVTNAFANRVLDRLWVPPPVPERPFVLFPLHRQPEATVDVQAPRYSNQLELVKTLARTLPATHELYVKEHPNGLGDRPPSVLREYAEIPSVRLVDPRVSTFALVDTAALTITISGTAAFEAALLGKPAVTIAPMFFGAILLANNYSPYSGSVAELLAMTSRVTDADRVDLLATLIASSFPGAMNNPNFAPEVLDAANLDAVARGYIDLLDGESWRTPRS